MTNKYLKITNKADVVPRVNLEKLGLSTKRNDPGTIGQFGSGIKFAPIAAMRNGWEWWFTGNDQRGQYKMKYTKDIEDGIECIVYDYGDYQKSSSFTVDAGSLSWITPFQIYREAVANALDESKDSNWTIDIVDECAIDPVDGEFSVFITAAPELMEIHNNFNKYFCVDRPVVYSDGGVDFLEKVDHKFRIYSHNVLVFETDRYKSIFDYNIDNVRLNEERTLASSWEVEYQITSKLPDLCDIEICTRILNHVKNDSEVFEFLKLMESTLKYVETNMAWFDAFVIVYGENCAIYNELGRQYGVVDSIKLRGYKPIFIASDTLYALLKSAEVRTYEEILGEDWNIDSDFNLLGYPNVSKAIEIAAFHIPEIRKLVDSHRIGIFQSDMDKNLGITIGTSKPIEERMIFINKEHSTDPVESILATIIHEYDHFNTGWSDADYRQFRDVADRHIASLMMKFYSEKFYELRDDVLVFPMSKLPLIGKRMTFTITKSPDFSVIQVGSKIMICNSDIEFVTDSGNLVISEDADCLTIPFLTNVKNVSLADV